MVALSSSHVLSIFMPWAQCHQTIYSERLKPAWERHRSPNLASGCQDSPRTLGGPNANSQCRSLECGLGGRKERVACRVLSVLSLHPTSAAQQRLFVHTQISLCSYTLPPLPSAITLSLILHKRRITTISQQHFHNQRICCDHQFTDR